MSEVISPAPVCEWVPNTRPTRPSAPTDAPAAPSAPAVGSDLVPLEVPFVDDQRYRLAPATEARTRLDLYLADPAGPWIRRHGHMLAFAPPANPESHATKK